MTLLILFIDFSILRFIILVLLVYTMLANK